MVTAAATGAGLLIIGAVLSILRWVNVERNPGRNHR
jgi:hypothetical protein